MFTKPSVKIAVLLLPLALLAACATLQGGYRLPVQHPADAGLGNTPPNCVDCHEARDETLAYERFNHTAYFSDRHRQAAYQSEQICALCHQPSYCNDCHATRVELKPSIKNQSDSFKRMPHRGDYLSRHRIDGRIDPTSCFRCHGNPKSAATCVSCHG
ncbi:MAG: cytochrome C [Desulfuromonadales bacterium]|nr:cytochrome C [Desulfuromonadales bacterium]